MYTVECHASFYGKFRMVLAVCKLNIDPRLMIQRILIAFYVRHLKFCLANRILIKNKDSRISFELVNCYSHVEFK